MDWGRAIQRNSKALIAIVAAIFALLEKAGGFAGSRISRPLHRALTRVLLPAESAARRLILIAARGLSVKPFLSRPLSQERIGRSGRHRLTFRLFDPRKRFAPKRHATDPFVAPRIHIFTSDPRVTALWPSPEPEAAPPPPPDDGRIDASRLSLRLQALKLALDDLPRQANRLARARARREKAPPSRFKSPLRPGPPPGHRKIPVHDVDHVLAECTGSPMTPSGSTHLEQNNFKMTHHPIRRCSRRSEPRRVALSMQEFLLQTAENTRGERI